MKMAVVVGCEIDSLYGGAETVGTEPKPDEEDEAGVHVALGLVAGEAGQDLVSGCVGAALGERDEVVAGG